jgi:hypothetical protein
MKVFEAPRQVTTDLPEADALAAEALIKEARQHQRRRHTGFAVVAVLVIAAASTAVAMVTNHPAARKVASGPTKPRVSGPPTGRVVSLKLAGPLAVGPDGALYVVDEQRHEVLVRLANGQSRVVAGDGKDGYSGDGGPATKAALSNVSDITFGRGGNLYIADGGRVRVVNTAGIITTIAGDGRSGLVADGTPALSAPLAPVNFLSIAFGPNGELYLSTGNQLLRLSAGKIDTVRAVVPSGLLKGPLDRNLGEIAIDGYGYIDVSGFNGWSIWQAAPNGTAMQVGMASEARPSGGDTSVLERAPNGAVYGEAGSTLLRVSGHELAPGYDFMTRRINGESFWLTYFAFAPSGTVYADELPGNEGFEAHQQLVSVTKGHVALLWQEKNSVGK